MDKVVYYKKGYKYQLTRPFVFQIELEPLGFGEKRIVFDGSFLSLSEDGTITAKKGYSWDGASGPTIDTKDSIRGSLVHDIGYQLIRLGILTSSHKTYFDIMLKDTCCEDGMMEWRAKLWQWAVLTFGRGSTRPSAEPQEEVAP